MVDRTLLGLAVKDAALQLRAGDGGADAGVQTFDYLYVEAERRADFVAGAAVVVLFVPSVERPLRAIHPRPGSYPCPSMGLFDQATRRGRLAIVALAYCVTIGKTMQGCY